jgi:hypothetical protein
VTVLELSPSCRLAGKYRVRGHQGLNVFRYQGRLHGRRLSPGTYLVIGHSVRSGRRLFAVRLVIVSGANPKASMLKAAGHLNECGLPAFAPMVGVFTMRPGSLSGGSGSGSSLAVTQSPNAELGKAQSDKPSVRGGTLGAIKTLGSSGATDWRRLLLFVLLGIALAGGAAYTFRDIRT